MDALRPFRFGVVAAYARSGEEWAIKARRVEELGYATLVVPDGLNHTLAPLPALAAAAAATRSLRVGTYVLANDFRNPVLLAKEAATLARKGAVSALTGTADEMCERLLERRRTLGISYIVVSDELMEALAPVVARLAGR